MMRVDCIFCGFESYGVDGLKAHSATCTLHPLAAERDQLRAENERLRVDRNTLDGYITDAHYRAFGSRHYAYVDPQSACDLLVADITATQHERDLATARAEAAERERDEAQAHSDDLRGALGVVLRSAFPHPVEHPTMTEAWKVGEAAIARTPAESLGRLKAGVYREAAQRILDDPRRWPTVISNHITHDLCAEADRLEATDGR